MSGEDSVPSVAWLDNVTLEGAEEPVRVVLDGREGHRVFVRQADPRDGTPPRIPLHPGDELIVMTTVAGIGHHTTPDVGRTDDFLFGARVVPVRREPGRVFARTLRRGEPDDGTRVHVRPGDQVVFETGSIVAELDAIDDLERRGAGGYTPLTPGPLELATAWRQPLREEDSIPPCRRLDAAARLLDQVEVSRTEVGRSDLAGPAIRRGQFSLIGDVELAVVALGRVVDMARQASTLIGATVPLPSAVISKQPALTEIRNAYEHIEDRALGRVRGKPHPEALTIFDHRQLIEDDVIAYARHELDLVVEVPGLLADVREFLKDVAGNT